MEETMAMVKGQKEQLHVETFHNKLRSSLILHLLSLTRGILCFFSLVSIWRIMCPRQKRSIANCADGKCRLFNLLYFSCAIICGCPLQMPHHVPLTEFVSSLIPAAVEECCFSLPWMIGPDSESEPVTVKRSSRIFFFSLYPVLVWAQHIGHLSLPSLSTWLNIVTSLMNCGSLSVSHSNLLSSCLSRSCQFYSLCFSNMFLHSPAANPFKGQWFLQDNKKGKQVLFGFSCVSLVTWLSCYSTLLGEAVLTRKMIEDLSRLPMFAFLCWY